MTDIQHYIATLGKQARVAAQQIGVASTGQKNQALSFIAQALLDNEADILVANQKDLDAGTAKSLEPALMDRLALDSKRVAAMAEGVQQIATLPDPVGEISNSRYMPSGIEVGHMRVPLGVIGIIYESRPNVTVDAAALCLKSGNATILRGGSEAAHSNQAIAQCIQQGLEQAGLSKHTVQVVETTDRAVVGALLKADEFVDVLIPRGGKSLVERVSKEAAVPVIKHLDGICHVYIDDEADLDKAHAIAFNAKTHRYGVCNAMETLLVAESVSVKVLPKLCAAYRDEGVELRGCERAQTLFDDMTAATEEDWATEYLAPVLSIKVVDDMQHAMNHIAQYSSQHTESIVTQNIRKAREFLRAVDSSSVMVNASTRFADGFEYGLGAEIGISTDKLHVRGPVGLVGLTTQKYVVMGDGHIRQ